ncbi:lantibiotic dehydratase [Streptomyces sp. NPDC006975]|uniref:lantibiotic dehydratase n=1 Tax=Streptomyces sp. NPDC006975 TaxID=3154310 RepID=UPI003452FCAF
MPRPIYRQAGDDLVVRAAVLPVKARPTAWPTVDSPDACRQWLKRVWDDDAFVAALRAASPDLVGYAERILAGDDIEPKRVRKATSAVAGYLLRATGRATPFGLFTGVALGIVGAAAATMGTAHQSLARPDTLWADHVRRELHGRPDVLPHLTLQVNTLAFQRGDSIVVPRAGGRLASARISRPLAVLLQHAGDPTPAPESAAAR